MNNLYFLLACADSEKSPLPSLRKERTDISNIFKPLTGKPESVFHLKNDLEFEVDTLVDAIRDNREVLHLFHFAGHANGKILLLDDQAANGEGIAQLLGKAPKLKLVFLNGCATKGHVNRLLNEGIAAIIATSAKVPDLIAQKFSRYFYEDFVANNRSLADSFDAAAESIKAQNMESDFSTRDTDDSFLDGSKDLAPWGLYLNPKYDLEEVKEWSLGKDNPFSLARVKNRDRNPFIVGPPIKNPESFFGRDQIIENLKDIQNRQVCLIGIRRIGKTSLIHQIANAYQRPQQRIPIIINLYQGLDISMMGRLLYKTIERAARDYEIIQHFLSGYQEHTFLEVLAEWGNFCDNKRIESLILIDEADQLSLLGDEGLTTFTRIFVAEYPCLSTIITGSRFLRTLQTINGAFLLQFEQKTLDVLPFEDAHVLLTQRSTLNVSIKNLEAITGFSGSHPYLSQYIASALYNEGRLLELGLDHDALVLKDELASVLADEYRRLSLLEKQVMRFLHFGTTINLDTLNSRIPVSRAELAKILVELKELSFVRSHQGQYALGNIFWEKYLQTSPLQAEKESPAPTQIEVSKSTPTTTPMPNTIFISHHEDDNTILKKLRIHLKPSKAEIRDSNSLDPGDERPEGFESQIDQAQIILLLLSASYIADDEKIQEREAIKSLKSKGKRIIPILASDCLWEDEFGKIVILPRSKKPIDQSSNIDAVLLEIVREIIRIL